MNPNYWEQLRFTDLLDSSKFSSIKDQFDALREFFKPDIVDEVRSEWSYDDYSLGFTEGHDEAINDIYDIIECGSRAGRHSDLILDEISDYLV